MYLLAKTKLHSVQITLGAWKADSKLVLYTNFPFLAGSTMAYSTIKTQTNSNSLEIHEINVLGFFSWPVSEIKVCFLCKCFFYIHKDRHLIA